MRRSSRMRLISCAEAVDLGVIEAAGRLVEQQQLRPRGERARKLDALLQAERQVGDAAERDVAEIEEIDQLPGDVGKRVLLAPRPGELQRVGEEIGAAERMAADAHIVEHRHGAEQREVLERAADADLGDAVRRAVEDAAPLEHDVARGRRVEAARSS